MVGPWLAKPYTFRALHKTFGPLWLRCDVCRRYARLRLTGLLDVDYRSKTFSCSRCAAESYLCLNAFGTRDFGLLHRGYEHTRHLFGDLILKFEDVFRRTVEAVRPQVGSGRAVDPAACCGNQAGPDFS